MREVFTHKEFTRVGHYQSILESEGIATYIRNGGSHNIVADIVIPSLYPVLCVENDADYERAVELLRGVILPENLNLPDWKCACGELVPGNFSSCWKCGGEATEVVAPAAAQSETTATVVPALKGSEYHRAVASLRLLLIVDIVFTIGFAVAGDAPYKSLNIFPPNALTPYANIHGIFAATVEVISALLCFGLVRFGRIFYSANIVVSVLSILGSTGGVMHRGPWVLGWLWTLTIGAVLAMLYFSPASTYFEKRAENP